MPTTYTTRFTIQGVEPCYDRNQNAQQQSVRLPASVAYSAGTVLCEIKGNNEVQTVTIDATGGTFTTTFGGQTTSAVAYNASAATYQAALEALSTIGSGNVSVQRLRNRWTITQGTANAGQYKIRVTTNFGTSSADTQVTATIAYNANTATVDAAVEALTNVGTGGVVATVAGSTTTLVFLTSLGDVLVEVVDSTVNNTGVPASEAVTETALGSCFKVTFQNDLGYQNVAAMTTGAGSLTGGAGTATVATLTGGTAATSGVWKQYSSTATDGSQLGPCMILRYPCATDSNSNITMGTASGGGSNRETVQSVPAWVNGDFKCSDVPDMTEAMLTLFGGRMVHGTIYSNGVFSLP